MLLSAVIPVFNEAPTVAQVVERLINTLNRLGFEYEIIIVDDCSEDESLEVLKNHPIKLYSLRKHMGKGYALRAGLGKAMGEIVATIDSDGSHRPEELPRLLSPLLKNQADLVIGSRYLMNKPNSTRAMNQAGLQIFNMLIKVLTRKVISDSQSGYRAMKSKVLEGMTLRSSGYEIESEMLVKTLARGFRVEEVPVSFEQRTYGKSQLDPFVDGLKILLSIVTARIRSCNF